MLSSYTRERIITFTALAVIFLIVHTIFIVYVRPQAHAWLELQMAIAAEKPGYRPERALVVTIMGEEQEAAIIMAIWSLSLAAFTSRNVRRQRALITGDFLGLPVGVRILPEDVQEYLRHLESLPRAIGDGVVPRVLRMALKRFSATRDVQDVSSTVHNVCETEGLRLDAELALLRFGVWSVPAIGFVGTVHGLGLALLGAELAVKGDTSAVTSGLGISFNSTFVALTLSILMMYVLQELQLAQDRLVLDTENYAEEHLIANLRST